jgi:cytochrome b involved in lipid metabolism
MGTTPSLPAMTAAQVAEDDRLLAFDDKFVIDLSRMLGRHPGGDQCLYNNKLKDIGRHMKFHSKQGRTLIKACRIAILHTELTEVG